MSFYDCWGLFGLAALVSVLVSSLPWLRRWTAVRYLLAGFLAAGLLLPLGNGLSLAGYIRGITGDLSVTTIAVVLSSFFFPSAANAESRKNLLIIVLVGGLVLYPLYLGPFRIEPYGWGYHPRMMLLAVAVAGFLLARRNAAVLLYLTAPILAYALHVSASTNLWDYLLDPLVFAYAIFSLLIRPAFRVVVRPLSGLTVPA